MSAFGTGPTPSASADDVCFEGYSGRSEWEPNLSAPELPAGFQQNDLVRYRWLCKPANDLPYISARPERVLPPGTRRSLPNWPFGAALRPRLKHEDNEQVKRQGRGEEAPDRYERLGKPDFGDKE